MNLLIKYPTRDRPHLFQQTLGKYLGMLSGRHAVRVVISADADDATMNNPDMIDWIAAQPNCGIYFNPQPQTKISAVNANMEGQEFDLLLLASDDMVPRIEGYDARIVDLFTDRFPDGDGVLHLNDGKAGRQLNTLCICDRKYYQRFNRIYPPQYSSLWADNEWQEVSESLGRAAYVDEVIIAHEWIGTTHPQDNLHRHNETFYGHDATVFQQRKAAGFPLEVA